MVASFRVFSKDDEGCIPAEEMKFVLSQVMMMMILMMLILIGFLDALASLAFKLSLSE